MSTVVYVKTNSPDKKLVKEHIYNYHPDTEMREKIISDVRAHSKLGENYIIDVKIEVTLKEYEPSVTQSHWYEQYPYRLSIKTK